MSAAPPIGPGSIVVCTSTPQNSCQLPSGYRLTEGALYCVEAIKPWTESSCHLCGCREGFALKGRMAIIYDPGRRERIIIGYCVSQFHPLNDGDTSLVTDEIESTDDMGLQTYRVLEPAR